MRRMTVPIGIKVRPIERELIERAAERLECTMSELIRRAAVARAKRVLEAAESSAPARG
jgi:uncharacterized protein (DUF1778 family)